MKYVDINFKRYIIITTTQKEHQMKLSSVLSKNQIELIEKMLKKEEFAEIVKSVSTCGTKESSMECLEAYAMLYGFSLIIDGEWN